MPRAVLLTSDNVVIKAVVADEGYEHPEFKVVFSDLGQIGDTYVPRWKKFNPPVVETVPDAPPERVTNSDWRVALLLWPGAEGQSRFDEVEAKVVVARDSGSIPGKIVWQRWEYANEVFRSELMSLRETFGFSEAEVDESLNRARAVSLGVTT